MQSYSAASADAPNGSKTENGRACKRSSFVVPNHGAQCALFRLVQHFADGCICRDRYLDGREFHVVPSFRPFTADRLQQKVFTRSVRLHGPSQSGSIEMVMKMTAQIVAPVNQMLHTHTTQISLIMYCYELSLRRLLTPERFILRFCLLPRPPFSSSSGSSCLFTSSYCSSKCAYCS